MISGVTVYRRWQQKTEDRLVFQPPQQMGREKGFAPGRVNRGPPGSGWKWHGVQEGRQRGRVSRVRARTRPSVPEDAIPPSTGPASVHRERGTYASRARRLWVA